MKWFYLAVQVTETVMSLMEQACSSINTIKKIYEKITSYKSTLEFYLTDYIDFRNGNFESSSSVTEDTTSLGDTQLATATRYNYTLKDALYSACKDILSACKELHEALQEDITFPQDVLEYFDSDSCVYWTDRSYDLSGACQWAFPGSLYRGHSKIYGSYGTADKNGLCVVVDVYQYLRCVGMSRGCGIQPDCHGIDSYHCSGL